jgi:general stress protein YciG
MEQEQCGRFSRKQNNHTRHGKGVPIMAEKSDKSGKSGQSKGGQQSGGNFKNDPKRASEAGKKGGEHSHGGTHEHVKAGQQSHKNK